MTATSIPYFLIGLALVSLIWIAFGALIDGFNDVNAELGLDDDLPYSAERMDAWNFGRLCWENVLIIVVIGFIVGMIIEAITENTGWSW